MQEDTMKKASFLGFSLFSFIASEDQIVNMHIRSKNFNPTELSLVFEVLTASVP